MRTIHVLAVAVPLMLLIGTDLAGAQNYPWCAQYSTKGGPRNCGFVSWEQCMATVRGVGGFCEQNFLYRPTESPPVRRRVRRHHG